jgi:hypothetical protein
MARRSVVLVTGAGGEMGDGRIHEDAWLAPITIYGCTKLHCVHLGCDKEDPGGRLSG